ncbi:SDR family NAD(P)-dependent oxidoreductase [Streptomonospora alba]|uniref:SDR family NAD(P)-dependent oxidoreductase n=1 Tax=Streptomonospora alba TaxID=183763 RepID=UPI0006999131|nr:SDR family NAD(P)-dependent oxidoreductase [Streptomonospora alba]
MSEPETGAPVALVTGASGVVGSQAAVALSARGYRVAVHGRSRRRLARTVQACSRPEETVLPLTGDLDAEGVAHGLVDAVLESFGRLDVLVAAAGAFPKEDFEGSDEQLWHSVLALNLTAQTRLLRRALEPLRRARPGVVVLLGSEPVTRPVARPDQEAYYASKGGLLGLARGLQASLLHEPVSTVIVHPDWTLPDREVTDPAAQIPAGRLGEALAHVVAMAGLVRVREVTLHPLEAVAADADSPLPAAPPGPGTGRPPAAAGGAASHSGSPTQARSAVDD